MRDARAKFNIKPTLSDYLLSASTTMSVIGPGAQVGHFSWTAGYRWLAFVVSTNCTALFESLERELARKEDLSLDAEHQRRIAEIETQGSACLRSRSVATQGAFANAARGLKSLVLAHFGTGVRPGLLMDRWCCRACEKSTRIRIPALLFAASQPHLYDIHHLI
jgi:hypothetical protein